MAEAMTVTSYPADTTGVTTHRAHQAYQILHLGYTVLPIVAGFDKFLHLLVNWNIYLAPIVTRVLPVTVHSFMLAVGVIEIIAGLLVAVRPQIGAYVVMLWLWGIIVNLLLLSGYYDIALRDFGLSLGALALGRLSSDEWRRTKVQTSTTATVTT